MKIRANTGEVYNHWVEIRSGRAMADADDELLIETVGKAIRAGMFYSLDVGGWVADALGVSRENLRGGGVEGGIFGYECYFARQELDRRAETAEGWVTPSQQWLAQRVGRVVEVKGEGAFGEVTTTAKVRLINGVYYLMKPKARRSCYRAESIKARDLKPKEQKTEQRNDSVFVLEIA